MADPDLTSTACDGETDTVQLGTDTTSLTPNKRLAVVKRDNRTIINDPALAAPGNNGDLPGGLKVNICGENAEIPYAARTQDPNSGNVLRVQTDNAGGDCGLTVLAPLLGTSATEGRVTIPQNVDGANPAGVLGPVGKTLVLTNNDSVDRLYTVHARASSIVEIGSADTGGVEMQVAARSEVVGGGLFVNGAAINERVATLTYDSGDYDGRTLNDARDITDHIIIPAGVTRTIEYRARTIRSLNTIGAGVDRGILFAAFVVRSEQVRTA